MKILYAITKSNWGGAQRNVYDLAVAMKEKGHTAIVALGGDGVLRKRLEDAGIKTHPIGTLGRDISFNKDAGSFKEIFKIIKREKPDILHLHSPKAAGLGALAGRILRVKKIIVTVHGWSFNESRPLAQKILITLFSWLTLILAHKTILLSEREYLQASRFPWSKGKIVIVPLGIKQPVFISIDGARQELGKLTGIELNELNKKFVIGLISELHPNKGLVYMVNAMKEIVSHNPNTVCIIIGDGEQAPSLQMQIKSNGLEKNIYLTGYLENALEYMKAFNLFVLPSIKEGLPYVILESAFASLPVVATTVGGIPEIIEDMRSGVLIQPKSVNELVHAVTFMIEHPQMRREYGSVLRETVSNKFSIEKMIDSVTQLYENK